MIALLWLRLVTATPTGQHNDVVRCPGWEGVSINDVVFAMRQTVQPGVSDRLTAHSAALSD